MSTLKEKFDNYTPQPDPKVWEGINSSLMHIRMRRRLMVVTSAVAVGAGAVALFFALNNNNIATSISEQDNVVIAENTSSYAIPQTVDAADAEVMAPVDASAHSEKTYPSAISSDFADMQEAVSVATPQSPASDDLRPAQQDAAMQQPSRSDVASASAASDNQLSENTVSKPATSAAQDPKADDSNPATQSSQRRIAPNAAPTELVVWIPNAFSPDDPVEESARTFKVFPNTDASILSFEIFIYSRTGRLVYHSKDYTQGWDGTSNGHKQPMGTYVYIIELNDAAKGLQHTKGTITLLR